MAAPTAAVESDALRISVPASSGPAETVVVRLQGREVADRHVAGHVERDLGEPAARPDRLGARRRVPTG